MCTFDYNSEYLQRWSCKTRRALQPQLQHIPDQLKACLFFAPYIRRLFTLKLHKNVGWKKKYI